MFSEAKPAKKGRGYYADVISEPAMRSMSGPHGTANKKMATYWTSYIWKHYRDLRGSELLCALALANFADRTGRCTPGFKKLAQEVRVSLRHVQFLIGCLERKKIIRVRRGRSRGQLSVFQMIKDESVLPDQVVKDKSQNAVRPETKAESQVIVCSEVDLCDPDTGPIWYCDED